MARKLRLYVWHEVLTDYTDGVMFALASSAGEARRLILESQEISLSYVERELVAEPKVYDAPAGFAVWGGG